MAKLATTIIQGALDVTDKIRAKGGLVLEKKQSDPSNPEIGQIWYRTDLD